MFESPLSNTYLILAISLFLYFLNILLKKYFHSRKYRHLKKHEKEVFNSIREKDFERFKTLFKEHEINANLADINGVTLLIYAVNMFSKKESDVEREMRFIKFLLECKDIDINREYSQVFIDL